MWSCEECDNGDACERCDIPREPVLCGYCYWQYWLKRRNDEREWHKIVDLISATWNTDYGSCIITEENEHKDIVLTTGGWSDNEELIGDLEDTFSGSFIGKRASAADTTVFRCPYRLFFQIAQIEKIAW